MAGLGSHCNANGSPERPVRMGTPLYTEILSSGPSRIFPSQSQQCQWLLFVFILFSCSVLHIFPESVIHRALGCVLQGYGHPLFKKKIASSVLNAVRTREEEPWCQVHLGAFYLTHLPQATTIGSWPELTVSRSKILETSVGALQAQIHSCKLPCT